MEQNKYGEVTFKGITYTSLKVATKVLKCSYNTVLKYKRNYPSMSNEEALDKSLKETGDIVDIEYNGKRYYSLRQLAEEFNIKYITVQTRYYAGWTPDKIVNFSSYDKRNKIKSASSIKKSIYHGKPIIYEGKEYISEIEASRYLNFSVHTLNAFRKKFPNLSEEELISKAIKSMKNYRISHASVFKRKRVKIIKTGKKPVYRGIKYSVIGRAFGLNKATMYRYQSVEEKKNFLEKILFWKDPEYLGFTNDGKVLLRRNDEILSLTFKKWIEQKLKKEGQNEK